MCSLAQTIFLLSSQNVVRSMPIAQECVMECIYAVCVHIWDTWRIYTWCVYVVYVLTWSIDVSQAGVQVRI